jgi:tryptophan synthase beta subunit
MTRGTMLATKMAKKNIKFNTGRGDHGKPTIMLEAVALQD